MSDTHIYGYETRGWIYYDRSVAESVADGEPVHELIRREQPQAEAPMPDAAAREAAERERCLNILRSVGPDNPLTVNDCIDLIAHGGTR